MRGWVALSRVVPRNRWRGTASTVVAATLDIERRVRTSRRFVAKSIPWTLRAISMPRAIKALRSPSSSIAYSGRLTAIAAELRTLNEAARKDSSTL
jgi:hypothetical protein